MTVSSRGRSWFRRSHRWLGLAASIPVLVIGVTGVILENPGWLGEKPMGATCVSADPGTPGRLLRGVAWGVEESVDGGSSWRELPMLAPPASIIRIVFGPPPHTSVVVLGSGSMIRSDDGGRIWRDVALPARPSQFVDVSIAADGGVILLTDLGTLRQDPGSVAWEWLPPGPVENRKGLAQWIHDLHTGQALGAGGRLVAQITGAILVLLVLTGAALIIRNRNGKATR